MDIRSFFGGKPPSSSASSQKDAKATPKKTTPVKPAKKRKSKVVGEFPTRHRVVNSPESDEDDDDKYSNTRIENVGF
jgi:hypothetical protein